MLEILNQVDVDVVHPLSQLELCVGNLPIHSTVGSIWSIPVSNLLCLQFKVKADDVGRQAALTAQ